MDDLFVIHWGLEKDNNYDEIEGESFGNLIIIPQKTIKIKALEYRLVQEIRGKIKKATKILSKNTLLNNEKLIENKEYSYPIRIQNKDYETYEGINVSVLYKVEIFLELEKESLKELYSKFDLISKLKSKTKFTESKYLTLRVRQEECIVVEDKIELDIKNRISIISFLGYGIIIAYVISMYKTLSNLESFLSVLALVVLVSVYLIYLFLRKKKFGKINAIFSNETTTSSKFSVNITNENRWKNIKKVLITYSIIEEVEDNRGTSSQVYKKELYRSKTAEIKNPLNTIETEFEYPKEMYRPIKMGDVKVYWLLELRLKPMIGPILKYENEFKVK